MRARPGSLSWAGAVRASLVLAFVLVATISACAGDQGPSEVALDMDDLRLDAATGLPILPTAPIGGTWWWRSEPREALDPGLRFVPQPANAGEAAPELPRISLLAAFPDHASAVATAGELAGAVGTVDAEARWLTGTGVDAGPGFEWLGTDAAGTPFVEVIDRWLVIDGLRPRDEHDQWEAAAEDGGPVYRSPLASGLRATGAGVLVEGDRGGEGAIAFDLICDGDQDRLLTLGQELADHGLLEGMRPPWIAPPLTDAEIAARRTLRLVQQEWSRAFLDALDEDDTFARLTRELGQAAARGDDERTGELIARLQAHVAAVVPEELPDLGPLEEVLDAHVAAAAMAEYADRVVVDPGADSTRRPSVEEHRLEAAPFGPSASTTPWRSGNAYYGVELDGGRLRLSSGVWTGVAPGLGPFVDYLAASGCDELSVAFHDYDDVRGD